MKPPVAKAEAARAWRKPGLLRRIARTTVLYNTRVVLRLALDTTCGVRVIGEENVPLRRGVIIASNHTSLADVVVLQAYTPRFLTYMMTDEYYYIPILHTFVRFWGVLVVKTKGLNKASIRAACEALGQGAAIGIFPEGGLSRDGRVHDALPGVALLAERARVPIVPVGLAGIERVLPPDTWRLSRSPIRICFGEPILPGEHPRGALTELVTQALRSCADRARRA